MSEEESEKGCENAWSRVVDAVVAAAATSADVDAATALLRPQRREWTDASAGQSRKKARIECRIREKGRSKPRIFSLAPFPLTQTDSTEAETLTHSLVVFSGQSEGESSEERGDSKRSEEERE